MIRVVSLFCGLGGWDLGLYQAAKDLGLDVRVVAAYDSWEPAVKCYNANLPHPVAEVRDLKAMQRDELPPHDLVIGGPPCQDHSLAGLRKCRCNYGEEPTPRCCLRDFVRLASDSPYVMENVVAKLINAPWAERLCAADFGDVTSRKRWFYSNYLLHVIPTPGSRRIRDIRDHDEDARILAKRAGCKAGDHSHFDDTLDTLDTLTAHSWHGHDIRGRGKLIPIPAGDCLKYPHQHYADDDTVLKTLRGKSTNAPDGRGWEARIGIWTGEEMAAVVEDEDFLKTLCASDFHGTKNNGSGNPTKGSKLRLGLRGNSASASAFEDHEILGSVLSNSFHANEASKLVGCRNPSLLEMARAHSIPDSFDWCGATKTQGGQMIANSVPAGMAAGVCRAILTLIAREKGLAA